MKSEEVLLLLEKQGKPIQFPLRCVGYELSSRAVASQVFSPLQSLTSVFGMGTGGPSALMTLTFIIVPIENDSDLQNVART